MTSDGVALAEGPRIDLSTVYLPDGVANARLITVRGELGGAGTLVLDPNTCVTNAFGDRTVCTEIAPLPIEIRMSRVNAADPSGRGRRIYRLDGKGIPADTSFALVVPRRRSEPHRLVVVHKDRRRAITLEATTPTTDAKEAWTLTTGTFRAEQRDGKVTIRAKGENPSAGFRVRLERLPTRIWPPQYKLVRLAPDGATAQVITPFEVSASFESKAPIPAVIVHDEEGTHRIRVGQADDGS